MGKFKQVVSKVIGVDAGMVAVILDTEIFQNELGLDLKDMKSDNHIGIFVHDFEEPKDVVVTVCMETWFNPKTIETTSKNCKKIIIGDPCYFIPRENDTEDSSWGKFLDANELMKSADGNSKYCKIISTHGDGGFRAKITIKEA